MAFQDYARFYDLLNSGKDYAQEVAYLRQALVEYGTGTSTILDMGCGTGRHARELAKAGFTVHGVDRSRDMVRLATKHASGLESDVAARLSYDTDDVREYRAGRCFNAVTALFHVVSYQTTNQALMDTFLSAGANLQNGGLFLFDVWYGPAVLNQRPERRERSCEDGLIHVRRKAQPTLKANENIVEVNYEFVVTDKKSMSRRTFSETHTMRYLFTPEICSLAETAGMEVLAAEEWLTGRPPGLDTWSVFYVLRKT
jgi:SAM-dependent methyltransferase